MPIMAIYRARGVTRAAFAPYEADIQSGPVPQEALLHLVGFSDAGLCVVDVWTERRHLEAWTESRIKPGLKRYGITYVEPELYQIDTLAMTDKAQAAFTLLTSAPALA
jgi:hypothetical protein